MIKYFKTLWENNITPVNGRNLNKIEDALEYLYDVIRNVPSEENIRISNEKQRQKDETTRSNSEIKRNATFDSKIKDVDKAINASNENIVEVNNKFESITASKQQDAEVIIARDGEESLNNRLKRDLYVDNIPLKQKVLDIEGLKEMQDLEYETDNGYKICKNTKNGVVKDLKLHGRSLVNIFNRNYINNPSSTQLVSYTDNDFSISNAINKYVFVRFNSNIDFEIGKTYTFAINVLENNYNNSRMFIETNDGTTVNSNDSEKLIKGLNVLKLTVSKENSNKFRIYTNSNDGSILKIDRNILVLEGDHTQNPPSYFDGIASVGNGNEIEVSSVKSDGNLFDGEFMYGDIDDNTGIASDTYKGNTITKNFNLCEGIDYNFKTESTSTYVIVYEYDYNKKFIKRHSLPSSGITRKTLSVNTRYFKIKFQGTNEVKLIVSKNVIVGNEIFKQDKKPILFKDADGNWKPVTELRGIDLNNCDTIEKNSDGKYYLHVRTEKYVVTGNEVIDIPVVGTNTSQFRLTVPNLIFNQLPICNMFKSLAYQSIIDEECVMIGGSSNIHFKLLKSKATTVDEFKQFAKNNNIELVVAINKEKVYEVSPLDLEAFENETMWMIESGPVSPHSEFKVTSSIQNFAKNTAERVDRLEDEVYKMNLANFAVSLNALELKSRLEALEAPRQ